MSEENKTIFDYERASFKLGDYKLPINDQVNEIVEMCHKEFPDIDLYLLWTATVDYVMTEELKITKKDNAGTEMYEGYLKQRQIFQYDCVKLCDSKGEILPITLEHEIEKLNI